MKSAAKLSTAFLAATLMAGEIDPKFLSLIPPDAKVFYGIDVERYRNSMLAEFFPVRFDLLSAGTGHAAGHQVRQVIVAAGGPENSRPPLTLLRGELFLSQLHAVDRERNGLPLYRGVPVFSTVEQGVIALLDQATAVIGDVDIVCKAIDRWSQQETRPEDIAASIRQLSSAYDNWLLALKPLANAGPTSSAHPLKYRNELMQAIEEVRGGIRFGGSNEVSVELVMRTPDGAMAMAAMSRWLPRLVQMEGYGNESLLANLVENLVVQAQGRIVSVSFSILESSMQELVSSLRAERQNDQ